jgi:hypothetical protein
MQQEEEAGAKTKGSEADLRHLRSSSADGDSHSEDGNQSHGEQGPPVKRSRKIPKLPMVRHGKKWYRARLLKDTSARVQIGELLAHGLLGCGCTGDVKLAFQENVQICHLKVGVIIIADRQFRQASFLETGFETVRLCCVQSSLGLRSRRAC